MQVNLWRIQEETVQNMCRNDSLWDSWCEPKLKIAAEVCEMLKGCHKKTTWQWTKEIATKVKKKEQKLKNIQKMAENEGQGSQETIFRRDM